MNTPLCSEASQGQFSWKLNSEQAWSLFREVYGSGEAKLFGELDIFIITLKLHIKIDVHW